MARFAGVGWVCGAIGVCSTLGCSSASNSAMANGAPGSDFGGGQGSGGSPAIIVGNGGAPPEQELEPSFRVPVVTGSRLWSANPTSGRVALIDSTTYEVQTVEAGFAPTYLAAVPNTAGTESAIVLNVLSHDATPMHVGSDGVVVADRPIPTHTGANAWAVSPSGRWAVAWSSYHEVSNPDPTDGFQDVTVIDLSKTPPVPTRLTVGYRPERIGFKQDETRAYAITQPGVSVIALDTDPPSTTQLIQVTPDPVDDPASRDVSITPDGSTALVRLDGSADIGFVSLADGTRSVVTLSGAVTDLDLSADGKTAVAVVRDKSEVAVMPIPGVISDSSLLQIVSVTGEVFGSVSLAPDASVGLLYTNATPNDHVTILDRTGASPATRTVALRAPALAAFPALDGENAIVLMGPPQGSVKAGAFAVVPLKELRAPKIVGTDAPPMAVAIQDAPSGGALVTVRDDVHAINGVYQVRLPTLEVDLTALASPPLATGIVGGNTGYVAQIHPEGRVTFVGLDTGAMRTLTGFELAAKIVE